MKKIAFVVATPMTVNVFMKQHIMVLSKYYDITVLANGDLGEVDNELPVRFVHIPIVRDISLLTDIKTILKLRSILKKEKFDAVHSITPKAALVGMISSFVQGTKCRFHTFTGQVWVTKTGLFRQLLKSLDKLVFKLTTLALVDSPSQRDFLVQNGVVSIDKSLVLGSGSISGVDLEKFSFSNDARSEVRNQYSIPESSLVFMFLGRLCKDKGVDELLTAFKQASTKYPNIYLMLVGPNEAEYDTDFFEKLSVNNVITCGGTARPQDFFSASDCLVLPSYREGFGTTVLEAAACGVPTLASDIYGLSDAVVHEQTGFLHPVRNTEELTRHMITVIESPATLANLGSSARLRAKMEFSSEHLTSQLLNFYKENVGV